MKKPTWKIIMLSLVALLIVFSVVLIVTQIMIPRQKKEKAAALLEAGEYEAAYELLLGFDDQKSVETRVNIQKQRLSDIQDGSVFTFGSYEQDNNPSNGKEAIKWKALCREGDRILAISQNSLDCQLYNTECQSVSWETCTLRTWLNDTFLHAAFNDDELALIQRTVVSADINPQFKTSAGEPTEDMVFLLSIQEVELYFPHEGLRVCRPTIYARAQGCPVSKETGTSTWWTRSPGYGTSSAARVHAFGFIDYLGSLADCSNSTIVPGVRPALWINLDQSE